MRKLLCIILLLVMAVTALTACGAKPQPSSDSQESTTDAQQTSTTEAPADPKAPITFTMFNNDISFGQPVWEKEIIAQEITKKTGVTVDITLPLSDDGQKINLMLASGEKLTDFIYAQDPRSLVVKKLIEGKFVNSLDELMEKHAPDFAKSAWIVKNRPYFEQADGKIYFLAGLGLDMSRYGDGVEMPHYAGIGRREDIWEELGMMPMTTPDELEAFLLKVKETHKEITHPLLLTYPNNYSIAWNGVLTNYYAFGGKGNYYQDGATKYFIRDPKFLESVMFLNRLYSKGLINISTFTDNVDAQNSRVAEAKVAVYMGGIYKGSSNEAQAKKVVPTLKYRVFDMPTKPGETFKVPGMEICGSGSKCLFITKDCKDPARAIKFFEWLASEEGQSIAAAGREGIDWKYTDYKGKKVIEPIGYFKENYYNSDVMSKEYGYNKYAWAGFNYASAQVSWGNALSDEEQLRRNEMRAKTAGDNSIYDGTAPAVGSEEGVALVKIEDLIKTYVPKIVLAKNTSEAEEAYRELISKADGFGLAKVEAAVDVKYKENVAKRGK